MSIDGKVALVTGVGRGIGLAISRKLALAGAKVVVNDTGVTIDGTPDDPELAARIAEEIRQSGGKALASTQNAATLEGAKALVAEAEAMGPVEILVNDAAILQDRMVFNLDPSSWDAVISNNLSAAFYLTRLLSVGMRERLWGRIVNLVSSAGLIGNRGQASYGSAKGGLTSLSRIAALDLARYGVTVNAIAPFAHTRVTETIPSSTPWLVDYLATVKGVAPAESVAELVLFLCSKRARIYTGQTFGVRGRELFVFSQPRPVGILRAPDAAHLDAEFLERAFDVWEEGGVLAPLETDLMLMSRDLSNSERLRNQER